MSPQEQQAWFRYSSRALDDIDRLCFQSGTTFSLEQAFLLLAKNVPRRAPLSKVSALLDHLEELRCI
jgi:hypothetical protein